MTWAGPHSQGDRTLRGAAKVKPARLPPSDRPRPAPETGREPGEDYN